MAVTWTAIRVHFWHRNVRDTVVILKEGNFPHSKYPLWDTLMPWYSLNGLNNSRAQCKQDLEQKLRRLAVEGARTVT